jgi:A118 family predicted phage portal protein
VALPDNNLTWPMPGSYLTEFQSHEALYAGRTPGYWKDELHPQPDLASVNSEDGKQTKRVRLGLGRLIAQTSSNLVFGKGIELTVSGSVPNLNDQEIKDADDEIQEILDGTNFYDIMAQADEIAAVFGSAFITLVADPTIAPTVYANVYPPTKVSPVFIDGHLQSAVVWTDIKIEPSGSYWRWLSDIDNRTKTITSGLYRGSSSNLGTKMPADSIPQTAGLQEFQSFPQDIESLIFHKRNITPNTRRINSPYGRSDLQGSESLIVAGDLALTAWIADVRLTRPRIMVPSGALSVNSFGEGATFIADREVYTDLNIDMESHSIEVLQGLIRADDFDKTIKGIIGQVVTNAGYSLASFGLGDFGSAQSGSALKIREGQTVATVGRKQKLWTPVIRNIVYNILVLSKNVFGEDIEPVRPKVIWPEFNEESPSEKYLGISALAKTGSISIRTGVKLIQPDLSEEDVDAEVARIYAEQGIMVNESTLTPTPEAGVDGLPDDLNDDGDTGASNGTQNDPMYLSQDATIMGSPAGIPL